MVINTIELHNGNSQVDRVGKGLLWGGDIERKGGETWVLGAVRHARHQYWGGWEQKTKGMMTSTVISQGLSKKKFSGKQKRKKNGLRLNWTVVQWGEKKEDPFWMRVPGGSKGVSWKHKSVQAKKKVKKPRLD